MTVGRRGSSAKSQSTTGRWMIGWMDHRWFACNARAGTCNWSVQSARHLQKWDEKCFLLAEANVGGAKVVERYGSIRMCTMYTSGLAAPRFGRNHVLRLSAPRAQTPERAWGAPVSRQDQDLAWGPLLLSRRGRTLTYVQTPEVETSPYFGV